MEKRIFIGAGIMLLLLLTPFVVMRILDNPLQKRAMFMSGT